MKKQPLSRRSVLSATAATAATAVLAVTPPAAARAAAPARDRGAVLPDRYVVPGDRAFPTGSANDPRTGHLYVGSAEDGTLYRGHLTTPQLRPWSPDGTDGRSITSGLAVDGAGRLFVGGADTGTLRVYDTAGGTLIALLHGVEGGFVNEITVASDGTAYATDSFRPVIYRLTRSGVRWTLERWLDVARTPIDWVDGQHNLNGIVCVGRHLLTVNSNTGQLWRIDRHTGGVREVDLGGHLLRNGDGLVWRDGRLHVVQGNINDTPGLTPQVAVVQMSADLTAGRYTARIISPGGFRHPSSASIVQDRIIVVNSQYNRWIAGLPPEVLPFTLSSIPLTDAEPV
ncbi:SMP-30/gluconolactonase/LRE family protein [Streptomyces longisporoflavus]|uniref:SMP-30/gluconolactonase/LRE family protein n=1 Tax=Streptomyces longisporoflavus TaxID=28044 RepID=A0ABW7QSK9_9ACTN